ncbi:hypothetical protein CFP65_0571 [Kitasatospora sp. MMS16-BH015]|uniref:NACHT domain-containing protein n=1 Tax=Kitasatospora sp. MMS16-BH015 TaxID=2018025 RepID=UPI000CA11E88|nr:NACHT domain-containing protein [Kitasatospora sp. MMS16-BH015]AUG75533.1 hypothetical protein CFP65_0571 [Kitasatospora sp. MMS16-BH015]
MPGTPDPRRSRPRARPPELPAAGGVRRFWATLRRPAVTAGRRIRTRWLLSRGTVHAKHWWPPLGSVIGTAVTWLFALALLFWFLRALAGVFGLQSLSHPWGLDPDHSCAKDSYSCGVANSVVLPVLTAALASAVFLTLAMRSVRRYYTRRARHEPRALVESAGSFMGRVVGRDQLCTALMDNLRDARARRPHVVVGAIGTGKTALVVRLTGMLARKGAFPVPIRLRDAQQELDFGKLAFEHFSRIVEPRTHSLAETDRIWRRLRRQDKIVVLADGLEEALSGPDRTADRDNVIRKAIRKAGEARLPLVITSRPHDPLRAMEAAVTELEPLSEESALDYIASDSGWRSDRRRLDRIVEIAGVTDAPLYLQIAKDLYDHDLLESVWVSDDEDGHDSWELKFDLLEAWIQALIDDHLHPELPIDREDRRLTVDYMSVLACIGLHQDSAEVCLDRLEPPRDAAPGPYQPLLTYLERARRKPHTPLDVRLAATWATRLGLVEEYGRCIRFQHSIVQAYLGSRVIGKVLVAPPGRDSYFPDALRNPNRELLLALVLHSRSATREARCTCTVTRRPTCPVVRLVDLLTGQALSGLLRPSSRVSAVGQGQVSHAKLLDLYGAALDIDSVDRRPRPGPVVEALVKAWPRLRERDPRRLRAAKLSVVHRLGTAARRAAPDDGGGAYEALFGIGAAELTYRVRIAVAQEIGLGGRTAYEALPERLHHWEDPAPQPPFTLAAAPPSRDPIPGDGERGRRKEQTRLRGAQALREAGRERAEAAEELMSFNHHTIAARVIPLLVDSAALTQHQGTPYPDLEHWVQGIVANNRRTGRGQSLRGELRGIEVALAHGFKHAANCRCRPGDRGQAREFLAEQAWELLRSTRFWFTRLTLLHALTLWALPDDVAQEYPMHGHGADPAGQVRRWLQLPDGEREHRWLRRPDSWPCGPCRPGGRSGSSGWTRRWWPPRSAPRPACSPSRASTTSGSPPPPVGAPWTRRPSSCSPTSPCSSCSPNGPTARGRCTVGWSATRPSRPSCRPA